MTRCPDEVIHYMHDSLDGDISREEERILNEHLETCMDCQQLYKELCEVDQFLGLAEPIRAPEGFVEGVMTQLPQQRQYKPLKKKSKVSRWPRQHPLLSAAALFLILMSAALFSSYNTNEQFSVTMQPNIVIEGTTVVVPKGEVVEGDLVVKNGDLRIEGRVDGDVTVIRGEKYMASSAVVTGNIEEIDAVFDWLWYKMKTGFTKLKPTPSE